MEKVKTNWTKATTNPSIAMMGLVSCIEAGYNAWIEVRKNGDQAHPIMKVNPQLDNPFNWQMSYETLRNENELKKYDFINETQKDLTYNWTYCYGTQMAVEAYKKDRTILEGLMLSSSPHNTACPIRIEDANTYRRIITGDRYEYGYFVTFWKPKKGIEAYIVDETVENVFVVCYTDEPVDRKTAVTKAGQFLLDYAKTI